jgi:Na+/phosphate symporter
MGAGMKSKNPSIEANLAGAKAAARKMMAEWARWKLAHSEKEKQEYIAKYTAAVTSCKVFIENYLKRLYPNEITPAKISKDIRRIISDIDQIEKINERLFQKIFKDIDQLSRDAA